MSAFWTWAHDNPKEAVVAVLGTLYLVLNYIKHHVTSYYTFRQSIANFDHMREMLRLGQAPPEPDDAPPDSVPPTDPDEAGDEETEAPVRGPSIYDRIRDLRK
jgi:hypothetical protein